MVKEKSIVREIERVWLERDSMVKERDSVVKQRQYG